MNEIIEIQIGQFALTYLLLVIVLFVMKKSQMNQSKFLLIASIRMTVQLTLAGFIITYIFQNPHPFLQFYI